MVSLEPYLVQAEQPQLSHLTGVVLQWCDHLHSLALGLLQQVNGFLVLKAQPCTRCSRRALTRAKWRDQSPQSTRRSCLLWWSPGWGWLSGLWAFTDESHWAVCWWTPWNHSPWSVPYLVHNSAWDCPHPSAGPCTLPCWSSWGLHKSLSPACQEPSGWHPFQQCGDCTALLGVTGKADEGTSDPAVHGASKDATMHQSQYWHLRNATCHWFPLGYQAIDHLFEWGHPDDFFMHKVAHSSCLPSLETKTLLVTMTL